VFSDEHERRSFVDIFASKDHHTLGIEFDAHRKIKKKSIKDQESRAAELSKIRSRKIFVLSLSEREFREMSTRDQGF